MIYLDNNDLEINIKLSREKDEVNKDLHESFELIYDRLSITYNLGIFKDDIKQEVLIKLYKNYKLFKGERGKAFSFITQITKNTILNQMRKLGMVDQDFKRIDHNIISYNAFDNELGMG